MEGTKVNGYSGIIESINKLKENRITKLESKFDGIEYLASLNYEQKIAATRMDGNYLVMAGPGTGKTHTLVYRVLFLIRNNIDPSQIVIITFTRKAANQLKERIADFLPKVSLGFVGTFHSFAIHLGMKYRSDAYSKYRMLDDEDDISIHKILKVNYNFNNNFKASTLKKICSYCANTLLTIRDYIEMNGPEVYLSDLEQLVEYKKKYIKYKQEHGLITFDDMISKSSEIMEKVNGKHSYKYLMIDEYQDTNQLQLEFIHNLRIPNLMVIGDDFQSIYRFRGADNKIILNFYNEFKNSKSIYLVKNYRSDCKIIECINLAVKNSKLGYIKELESTTNDDGKVKILSTKEEYDGIFDEIEKYPDKSHAIIYKFNRDRTIFEKELIQRHLNYVVYGGIRLLERKHIKDVLAFLLSNANHRDQLSLLRIVRIVPSIGEIRAARIVKSNFTNLSQINSQATKKIKLIKNLVYSTEDFHIIFIKVCEFYMNLVENIENEYYTLEEIKQDFNLIKEIMVNYTNLFRFIMEIVINPNRDKLSKRICKSTFKGNTIQKFDVVLSTIHSVKGLEFDFVYHKHIFNWFDNYDLETAEESRRLFYVAISRAKHTLYILDDNDIGKRTYEQILTDFDIEPTVKKQNNRNCLLNTDFEILDDELEDNMDIPVRKTCEIKKKKENDPKTKVEKEKYIKKAKAEINEKSYRNISKVSRIIHKPFLCFCICSFILIVVIVYICLIIIC